MTELAAPSAKGANKISTFKNREVIRLAAAVKRNPRPRIQNDLRAPARLTKKPALMLTTTISSKPSHVCGVCSGVSPRPTLTTNAACSESLRPARQTAHVATPATKDKMSEVNSDFQVNVFKTGRGEARAR